MSEKNVQQKKSILSSIQYDSIRHQLDIIIRGRKYSYLSVPDSVYARLILADIPDQIYWDEVYNKYPVVLETPPLPPKTCRVVRKKKKPAPKEDWELDFDLTE